MPRPPTSHADQEPTSPPFAPGEAPPALDGRGWAELVARSHEARFDSLWWGFVDTYASADPFRIVDFGSGAGMLVRDLCERFPDAEVIGVDWRDDVLEHASALLAPYENARLITHDLATGPVRELEDAQADVVIAAMVLRELPTPTRALDEACRVLAPGGTLLVYDWARPPLAEYARAKGATKLSEPDDFARFSSSARFTAEDFRWLVEQCGFEVHEVLTRYERRRVMIAARRRESE